MNDLRIDIKKYPPESGRQSGALIVDKDFPLEYGNYCWINGGPYLVNCWAENLNEWSRQNPDVQEIEITEVSHGGDDAVGIITDERLQGWCNAEACVLGKGGWPSVEVQKAVSSYVQVSTGDC